MVELAELAIAKCEVLQQASEGASPELPGKLIYVFINLDCVSVAPIFVQGNRFGPAGGNVPRRIADLEEEIGGLFRENTRLSMLPYVAHDERTLNPCAPRLNSAGIPEFKSRPVRCFKCFLVK